MLLQQVVQVVTSLVIEVEVLALCLAFGAHHFGNSCPVSPMLNKPWCRAERDDAKSKIQLEYLVKYKLTRHFMFNNTN